ncbi:Rv3235 family protein [Leucobacter chinensis]|uniref:Rv3235 family protein n=1 Tax=Leucobacter chinensis TaxID=2851010 RepID=UPI001C237974|nr:Rv3235 family protein [Leucobacter chinensis]
MVNASRKLQGATENPPVPSLTHASMSKEGAHTAQQESQQTPSTLTIRTLALNAVEAVHGIRPLEQLSRYVTGEVFERLLLQRSLRRDRKAVYRDERRIVPLPGRIVSSMPHPGKIHAAVVMHTGERSFAVVLRLEKIESRWRATELAIL